MILQGEEDSSLHCVPHRNDRRFGDHLEGKQRRFEKDLSLKQV